MPKADLLAVVVAVVVASCGDDAGERCGISPADLSSDALNCGACFHACGRNESCVGGHCGCEPPSGLCDGVCTDLHWDPANCGSCGNACPPELSRCGAGQCRECPLEDQWSQCGDPFCSYLGLDNENCGSCGEPCDPGDVCVNGRCVTGDGNCEDPCDAAAGFLCCHEAGGDRCAKVLGDENHCERCGAECYTICDWYPGGLVICEEQ